MAFRFALLARAGVIAAAAILGLFGSPARADHPNALWHVVHGLCLRDMRLTGRPAPCLAVDIKAGHAVVPDLLRPTQILLTPTEHILGIESPELLAPQSINYWQAAWDARRYFESRVGRPVARDRIGMAVNSIYSRSQDLLHIHVDCVRADVRQTLADHEDEIGGTWTLLKVSLAGRRYFARRVEGADLATHDPFKLLAEKGAATRDHMGPQTLVVIGAAFADGSPGFFVLTHRADLAREDQAFGENLLDHTCAVLKEP